MPLLLHCDLGLLRSERGGRRQRRAGAGRRDPGRPGEGVSVPRNKASGDRVIAGDDDDGPSARRRAFVFKEYRFDRGKSAR